MTDIGKGDWVQLVRIPPGSDPGKYGARLDGVYCVESIESAPGFCSLCDNDNMPGINLGGITLPPKAAFCACQLKPLGGNSRAETRKAPQDVVTERERKMQDA